MELRSGRSSTRGRAQRLVPLRIGGAVVFSLPLSFARRYVVTPLMKNSFHSFDALVVGSGFAGAVLAERMASQRHWRVLLIERRQHIGGNMYDCLDARGILVHRYGPHIFRTDSAKVWNYLSQFTQWRAYEHRVLAMVDGQLVPVPFNLTSIDRLFPVERAERLKTKLHQKFGGREGVPVRELMGQTDGDLAELGGYIFEKIYRHYTRKQWGLLPEAIDFEATTRRVPVQLSRDDRYFQQRFQGIPAQGYTRLFERMLNHPNIAVECSQDARAMIELDEKNGRILVAGRIFDGPVIYSGAIDELFGNQYGPLPWRALRFEFESLPMERFQPVAVVNYPNEHAFTRITEFKHLTGQVDARWTSIVREYPLDYAPNRGLEPAYPVLCEESRQLLGQYRRAAEKYQNLWLVGRLAEYRYYDMNDIVSRALDICEELDSALNKN